MSYSFIGNTLSICKIRELIKAVSDTSLNVLISGETGTGKEVVARLLHDESGRRKERFIKVNCAALPFTLLESELFGYEKGAFTGAEKAKPGKFELASEGVVFLDEMGDMPMILQAKLLEVLQSGMFVRLGGTSEIKVNTWVISSTNHDLQDDIKKSQFREDLYYRLNIIQIQIPPLRQRREDIPFLTKYFIERNSREIKCEYSGIPDEMKKMFEIYHWPGNVRELSNTILRLMIGEDPEVICSEMVSNMQGDGISPAAFQEEPLILAEAGNVKEGKKIDAPPSLLEIKAGATRTIEKRAILYALNHTGWKKRAAARMLNISHKALYYKMENLGIDRERG